VKRFFLASCAFGCLPCPEAVSLAGGCVQSRHLPLQPSSTSSVASTQKRKLHKRSLRRIVLSMDGEQEGAAPLLWCVWVGIARGAAWQELQEVGAVMLKTRRSERVPGDFSEAVFPGVLCVWLPALP
jgi:hypothetical protein